MQTVIDYNLDNWPTEQLSGAGDWAWWVCQVPDFGECTLYVQKATYEVSVQATPSRTAIDNDMRKAVAIALANMCWSPALASWTAGRPSSSRFGFTRLNRSG